MVERPVRAFAPRKGQPPVDTPQSGAGDWQLARLASWGQPAAQLLIHQIRLNQTMNPPQSRVRIGTTLIVNPHFQLFGTH